MLKLTLIISILVSANGCTQRSADGSFQSAGINQRLGERDSGESLPKSACDESRVPGGMVRSDCIEYAPTENTAADRGAHEGIGGR